MALQIGDLVDGKYRILERLGAGGMGEVYKVEHVYLRAIRVVKVIRPQISESADAHERFLREAQLATKIQHPNLATLHDFSALPDGSSQQEVNAIKTEHGTAKAPDVVDVGQAVALANTSLFAPYQVATWSSPASALTTNSADCRPPIAPECASTSANSSPQRRKMRS